MASLSAFWHYGRRNPKLLGGSASHAAVAASFFTDVNLVGVVGEDFPKKYTALYQRHGLDLAGLQVKPGKTFHWAGEYEVNMNKRRTLATELGVFETFSPDLPEAYKTSPFVLLANIAPALQHHVLDQMKKPKFIVAASSTKNPNTTFSRFTRHTLPAPGRPARAKRRLTWVGRWRGEVPELSCGLLRVQPDPGGRH